MIYITPTHNGKEQVMKHPQINWEWQCYDQFETKFNCLYNHSIFSESPNCASATRRSLNLTKQENSFKMPDFAKFSIAIFKKNLMGRSFSPLPHPPAPSRTLPHPPTPSRTLPSIVLHAPNRSSGKASPQGLDIRSWSIKCFIQTPALICFTLWKM